MEKLRQVEILIPSKNVITGKGTIEVTPKTINGTFHCWEHHVDGEEFSRVYAIVEDKDGKVGRYEINEIRFTGYPAGSGMFEDGELSPE